MGSNAEFRDPFGGKHCRAHGAHAGQSAGGGAALRHCGRDSARAQPWPGGTAFAKSFAGYEALLADPAVDVVYIGSIHPLHAQHIRAALLAGKHVLCEKPLTLNAAQAQSLFALARERGLLLAEAMWTRTLPFAQALRKTLADGRLGAPRLVTAVLGEAMADIPRIAQPALGGGALLDIGVYALTLACLALEGDVERVGGVCVQNGLARTLRRVFLCVFPAERAPRWP